MCYMSQRLCETSQIFSHKYYIYISHTVIDEVNEPKHIFPFPPLSSLKDFINADVIHYLFTQKYKKEKLLGTFSSSVIRIILFTGKKKRKKNKVLSSIDLRVLINFKYFSFCQKYIYIYLRNVSRVADYFGRRQ